MNRDRLDEMRETEAKEKTRTRKIAKSKSFNILQHNTIES